MRRFWASFEKSAGSGMGSPGKGLDLGALDRDRSSGTEKAYGGGQDETTTDKSLRDAERGPKSYDIFDAGPEFRSDSNPHIRY